VGIDVSKGLLVSVGQLRWDRLRMLEEDRDELSLQAVALQRSVDAERTQRLIAEEAQVAAQQQVSNV
jgi:hypothetical protein